MATNTGIVRGIPAAPNWFCSRVCDVDRTGNWFVYGANNILCVLDVSTNNSNTTTNTTHSGDASSTKKQPAAGPCVVGCVSALRHGERVTGVAFCHHIAHPSWCVSAGADGSVKIWDIHTLLCIKEHSAHSVCVCVWEAPGVLYSRLFVWRLDCCECCGMVQPAR